MLSLDPATLFFTFFFSMVGIAYITYGKKNNLYFVFAGIGLLLYPYISSNLWFLIGIGLFLMMLPFILDRFFPFD